MSLSEAAVVEALRGVIDPLLRSGLVDLGMIGDVDVKRGGKVRIALEIPVEGWPLADLSGRIRAALALVEEIRDVEVVPRLMSDAERHAVRLKIRPDEAGDEGQSPRPLGHEAGRRNPFMDPNSRTRVLGMSSGKGGVGKSSITVNLAVSLARLGHDVAVLDADVYGFSIPKMLGIVDEPVVLDDVLLPPIGHGIRCISTGFFVEDEQPVMWRGPMLHKALEQFLVDVHWGSPDFLLVDLPPGTGDVALSMSQYLPKSEIYVITTPQAAAQRVAQRTAYMARKMNQPCRGVIENMSWFTGDDGKRYDLFGSGGGEELGAQLGVPLLAQIPLVQALRAGGDAGQPVTVTDPDGEAALAFASLAAKVVDLGPGRVYKSELRIT